MKIVTVITALAAYAVAAEEPKPAGKLKLEMAGVRAAFSATRLDENFYQAEAYARVSLPGRLDFGRDWSLRTAVDASAGMLGRLWKEDKGFIATLGPVLVLSCKRLPVDFVMGSSPTLLSRHTYDGVDFGIPFQFTTHLGFNTHLNDRCSLAYRLQHMSNASLSSRNPGLDLHSIALSFKF